MLSGQLEFARREKEIDEYLSHLEMLEQQVGLSVTLINTMKSSALLMMYNIVESTMTNLMQDIFDHLKAADASFDALNDTMKAVVLSYSKRRTPANLVQKMSEDAIGLVVACFDRSDVFSGNIDCKKITATLKELGIESRHRYREQALLTVKSERNHLAHGNKSFSDCGKDYAAAQLREFHERIKVVLGRVIHDFDEFLSAKAYS
jgi:hypothetical protein